MNFKVRYQDFFPGFLPENFLVHQVLKKLTNQKIEIVPPNSRNFVDLEIYSTFPLKISGSPLNRVSATAQLLRREARIAKNSFGTRLNYVSNAKANLWLTSENHRPPNYFFDGTISFDPNDKFSNNLFFPYWMMRLNWGFNNAYSEIMPSVEELLNKRRYETRILQACSFSSVLEPRRQQVVAAVRNVMPVAEYGKAFRKFVDSKQEVSTNFQFQICTENDLYPNYVTEKLHEAWISGNVPIWSGLDERKYFNDRAFIDVTLLETSEIIEYFENLSEEQIVAIYEEPILSKEPRLQDMIDFLERYI